MRESKNSTEYDRLLLEVEPGRYKIYRHPFPAWMTSVGRFQVNRAIVACFDLNPHIEMDGHKLRGIAFEIYNIRDDLRDMHDPDSKEINVDKRFLAKDDTGVLYIDHIVPNRIHSTQVYCSSAQTVEREINILGLDAEGSIQLLRDRGFSFLLDRGPAA